ncbi:MAG TPA: sigma-54 dependent transcriptional regulator [Pirellulaceae bacterium]
MAADRFDHAEVGPSAVALEFVGDSGWARRMRRDIVTIAGFPTTVLILGPTGTGKELIARAIHATSPRAAGPFVPIDCAAMTGALFAAHLFGHVRGAFTGAAGESLGAFRAAEGGTLFLDEMGELEPDLQAKLLRVLQQRTVVPVGGVHEMPIDVRIIAATNRDLAREVGAHRFREDLYYRLNVAQLRTIPLCQRREDIPILAQRALCRLQVEYGMPARTLAPETLEVLFQHDWPGNVRQLNNVLERALLFGKGPEIRLADLDFQSWESHDAALPLELPARESESNGPRLLGSVGLTMDEVERQHLIATLEHTHFNQTAAARLLGMDRNRLRREARRLEINLPTSRGGRPSMTGP